MKRLFFSDLDGTILDHDTYSYDESITALKMLREKDIPLIMVSSKTFEEMYLLSMELGLDAAFAFENGCGIAYPVPEETGFRAEITGPGAGMLARYIPVLAEKTGLRITPITSMSDDEIVSVTGLDVENARLARMRRGSLPFLAGGSVLGEEELFDLNDGISDSNIRVTAGARFNHIIPYGFGKGVAVKKIIEFYRDKFKNDIFSAGAGDSPADIPMLDAVDVSYIIKGHNGYSIKIYGARVMDGAGPAGFVQAVTDFISIVAG